MSIDKQASRRWGARLREVFMAEWDPIGVKGVPDAQDEYDHYVGKVAAMIRDQLPMTNYSITCIRSKLLTWVCPAIRLG